MTQRIALLKSGMLGDLLMMTPAIRRLKSLYPEKEIYLFTDERLHALFNNNPYISGLNLNINYDLVIDFKNRYDPTLHPNKIHFYFDIINQYCDLKLNEEIDYTYDLYVEDSKNYFGDYALFSPLCANNSWVGREVKNTKAYDNLIVELNKNLISSLEVPYGDTAYGKCKYTLPPCSLTQFMQIIKNSKLIVTIDTGTLHIAQALDKNIIAIFGKVPPESRIIPNYKNIVTVTKPIECIGCYAKNKQHNFCSSIAKEDCMNIGDFDLINAYLQLSKLN